MKVRTRPSISIIAAMLYGCSIPEAPPLSPSLRGAVWAERVDKCWELRGEEWDRALIVQFDTALASPRDDSVARVLRVELPDSVRRPFLTATWAPFDGVDSEYAVIGHGLNGPVLRLAVSPGSLRGRAYSFDDIPYFPQRSSRSLTGTRSSCELRPPRLNSRNRLRNTVPRGRWTSTSRTASSCRR